MKRRLSALITPAVPVMVAALVGFVVAAVVFLLVGDLTVRGPKWFSRSWIGDFLLSPAMAGLLALIGAVGGASLALHGVRRTVGESRRSSENAERWVRMQWALDRGRSEAALDRAVGMSTLRVVIEAVQGKVAGDEARDRKILEEAHLLFGPGIIEAAKSVYRTDVFEPFEEEGQSP